MRLAYPYALILLAPVYYGLWLFYTSRIGREAGLRFSSVELVKTGGARHSPFRRTLSMVLKFIFFTLFIIALARPQTSEGQTEERRDVVDVMLALDISSSMATLDFKPENRLGAAKLEAKRFIEARPFDRIGLVVFARTSFTHCPLTTDHKALLGLVDKVQMGMIEDGTAIGVGLANALNRLRTSEVKSKVIILLTDGVNNSGEIDPITAAEIAKELGIRVYTIGMGIEGEVIVPVNDPRLGQTYKKVMSEIDEKTLFRIAQTTGGLYFRAKDETALKNCFHEIDTLEKTEIHVEKFTRYKDYYPFFVMAGFAFLVAEILIVQFIFTKVP